MNLRRMLSDPPKPLDPWLRYGFLALCLGLLGWHLCWLVGHSWMRGRENISLVLVALLLNHLAFRFSWPRTVTASLRLAACAWLVFAVCCWLWLLHERA